MQKHLSLILTATLGLFYLAFIPACSVTPPKGQGQLLSSDIQHDNTERDFYVYVPPDNTSTGKLQPLLLVLHGGGGNARGMTRLDNGRFIELADQHGFFIVYPQGLGRSWNDGRPDPISEAHRNNVDDVGFVNTLIDYLLSRYPIDPQRVFAAGISNGGLMSFRLGCSLPHKIQAIAPVTASLPAALLDLCQEKSSVSLALFNGTEDPLVPYHGGQIRVFSKERGEVLSTEETISFWRAKTACNRRADKTIFTDTYDDGTRVYKIVYQDCEKPARVALYRIEGGGHTWPGGRQYLGKRVVGRTTRDINASDEIWKFIESIQPY